jgi:hypothetical protein
MVKTMKKNSLLIIILLGVFSLQAQNPFSLRGVFGLATIDDKVWGQFAIRPTIDIWKIKFGLDIVMYIDQNGKLHQDEWDFSNSTAIKNTILDKIYFIQYGTRYEPVYIRVGALNHTTLGYGILVNRYSNTFNYPQFRKIGLDAKVQSKYVSVQAFVNNFKENASVVGGRISSVLPGGVHLGISAVTDQNQYLGLQDHDYDGRPDIIDDFPYDDKNWLDSDDDGLADDDPNEFDRDGDGKPDVYNLDAIHDYWDSLPLPEGYRDSTFYNTIPDTDIKLKPEPLNVLDNPRPISAIAIDLSIPIIQNKVTSLSVYSQIAKMIGETVDPETDENVELEYGFAPVGVFNHLGVFSWQVEYRIIPDGKFDFEYWDRAYEHTRATVTSLDKEEPIDSLYVKPKSDYLGEFGAMRGLYGRVDFDINEYLLIGATFQNMFGEKWNRETGAFEYHTLKSFLASVELTQPVGNFQSASAFYQQRNVSNPFKFIPTESTIMGFSVGYKIGWGMILNYSFKRSFLDKNGDGDVLDKDESINMSLLETSFGF